MITKWWQRLFTLQVKTYGYLGGLLIFLSVVLWGLIKLNSPGILPIQEVKIAGNYKHINKKNLKKIIMPYAKNGFFAVNIKNLKKRLLELPWLAEVKVSRAWPNQLIVELKEQDVFAIWNKTSLLNNKGEVFTPKKMNLPKNVPKLVGPEGLQLKVLQAYRQMTTLLDPIHLQLKQLVLTQRQAWHLTFSNGMQVELGREQFIEKLKRFITVYPTIFAHKNKASLRVDMRYTNGMAVG